MKKSLLVIVAGFFLTSCLPAQKVSGRLTEQKLLDLAYGSFASSKKDVLLPANRNGHMPFVMKQYALKRRIHRTINKY